MQRGDPAGTEQGQTLSLALPLHAPQEGAPPLSREAQSMLEGRASREEEKMRWEGRWGGQVGWGGGLYSGKFSAATSGFILKYWLKRRTAYPKKSKSMVENLA